MMTTVLTNQEIKNLISQTYAEAEGTKGLLFKQKITIIQALELLQEKLTKEEKCSDISNLIKGLVKMDVEISDFHDKEDETKCSDSSEGLNVNEEFEKELVH